MIIIHLKLFDKSLNSLKDTMLKPFRFVLVLFLLLLNLVASPPVLADKMSEVSPEYPQVIQELNRLQQTQNNSEQSEYLSKERNQKISDLTLQKRQLETAEDWGSCRNETGKILAIYAHKPKSSRKAPNSSSLYFLAPGETTDEDWDCDGLYVPSDGQVAGYNLTEAESGVLKILDGTELVATTNPQTEEIVLSVPSAFVKVLKTDEVTWPIPNLTQANIDLQTPNAPTD